MTPLYIISFTPGLTLYRRIAHGGVVWKKGNTW